MTASQRIALNTLATYVQSVFALALGLFSSRWILLALGPVDYGLMGVVGAVIVFVTFLKSMTAAACARFFAFSIGKGDSDETNTWFNTALFVHIVLPLLFVLIGWPVGEWLIRHFLNVPCQRLPTALWVFRLSLVAALTTMVFTPYIGMFTAKQRIYEMSIWGILQAIGTFTLAYLLTLYRGDAWLLYSVGTVSFTIMIGTCQVLRARQLFSECRICVDKLWSRSHLGAMITFTGWQFFGGVGGMLRGQGIAILLNKYFTPLHFPDVNAAYSVGNNVSTCTQTLSSSLLGALAPEITASEGRGDRQRMLSQANRASKFGSVLVMVFAIPLIVEIRYVLDIWLKHPPKLAASFCVIMLFTFLIDKVSFGQMISVAARGKIAGYQAMIGGFLILTLPLAWMFLAFGCSAISVGWACIITICMMSAGRVLWAKYLVGASPRKWLTDVFLPCMIVLACGLAVGFGVQKMCGGESLARLCAVTGATSVSWVVLGWSVVLDAEEKAFFVRNAVRVLKRMKYPGNW